ncbi:HU family DNA-binding protein [Paracoccus sp. M683]|uniref:HU family DNA-binding protein n=1 Tax=Paracoccus sp. M683 TaxID=2594268 RepID=UPI00117FCCD1|nr:HU family DNA-binding protein [Paracoccus sp. M683]TRW95679.1 HU family DNA-binding protein [Paracoccus sp. M683]
MTKPSKPGRKDKAASAEDAPKPARVVQKREFVDRVVDSIGGKKGDVRPIVEATLEQLGRAFAAGETLVVQPFGRARVSMRKGLQNGGEVINLRLRRRGPGGAEDEE